MVATAHAPARPAWRSRHRLALIAVLIALLVGVPGTAWAYWTATATATAPLSTAANLPSPSVVCQTMPQVGLAPNYVRLSWTPVATANSYTVRLRSLDGTTNNVLTTTSATTTDVNGGLLIGLLAALLTALLGGATIYATVTAANANGWTSLPSTGTTGGGTVIVPTGTPLRWANGGLVCVQ